MKALLIHLLLLCTLLAGAGARAQVVNVYTSADFAPLMLGDGRGIYPDLIEHLNRQKPGGLSFKLSHVPRKRMQVLLEQNAIDGLVIGMMPEWFNDTAQKKYLWSAPFSTDGYVLVSQASNPLRPDMPAALVGATVGVTKGYVYPVVDGWLARSRMQRSEGVSDEKNLEKLLQGRVDCVIVAASMARYFIKTHKMTARLHVVPLAGPATERRFLAPHAQKAVFDTIAPLVRKLQDDPAWQKAVARYE